MYGNNSQRHQRLGLGGFMVGSLPYRLLNAIMVMNDQWTVTITVETDHSEELGADRG